MCNSRARYSWGTVLASGQRSSAEEYSGAHETEKTSPFYSKKEKKLTMLLHTLKEFNDNLGGRSDKNLSPTALFGVGNCLETIG